MLQTKVKLLCAGAQIPNRAYQGDAGYDLTAVCDVIIPARGIAEVSIGIALELPKDFYAEIASRSGLRRKGIFPPTAIIDNGYRGDIGVVLYNYTDKDYQVTMGEKVAQLLIKPLIQSLFKKGIQLNWSSRNKKGFGSSGK